jgi:flagellar biosynthetic protein FlhB
MADESKDDKTEAPSSKRRGEAREKGTIAKSTEINSVIVLLVGLYMLKWFGPWMMKEMGGCMSEVFGSVSNTTMDADRVVYMIFHAIVLFFKISAPVAGGILLAGILANIIQVGFLFTMQPIIPNLSKIDPIAGTGRLFSMKSVVEAIKNILKIIVIGTVAYWTVEEEFPKIMMLYDCSVQNIFAFSADTAFKIILRVALVLIVLAILDYAYQRYEHEKGLKMTKQEVKEEHKQMEGDPKVKSRIKQMQREMARRRMMQNVPKATVVVTNPTYIAIALRYDPAESDAPVVLAKGKRLVAARIKKIAIENDIPIVEDKPLARGMYDQIEVGFPIPAEFFAAVAEIMAYVYRLKHHSKAA